MEIILNSTNIEHFHDSTNSVRAKQSMCYPDFSYESNTKRKVKHINEHIFMNS